MKVPTRSCKICGAETELMYKVYDSAKQSHDVPTCIDCMGDTLWKIVDRQPGRRRDLFDPLEKKQRLYDLFKVDEAMAVFTEFADIKIQYIGEQTHMIGKLPRMIAIIVRSTYNNQFRIRLVDAELPIDDLKDACVEALKSIFVNNKYPEDMV